MENVLINIIKVWSEGKKMFGNAKKWADFINLLLKIRKFIMKNYLNDFKIQNYLNLNPYMG